MNRLSIVILSFASLLMFGCMDVIDVDLQEAPDQLVIDAWLNDRPEEQSIRLTLTQPYFNSTPAPAVTDAIVTVYDTLGNEYPFEHRDEGNYVWTPQAGENLGPVGTTYFLSIEWNGNVLVSQSTMNRVPPIDSIVVEYREAELGLPEGHYAGVFARDFTGVGDTYWIKSFKNGVYLNKPFELNIAYDAGFDAGSQVDGIIFVTPIREAINRIPDPDEPDNIDLPPWAPGDTITVEIHSMTQAAFSFMQIARDQMTNGSNTIFAIPLANTRGNVVDIQTEELALGIFCVSAVSSMSVVVE